MRINMVEKTKKKWILEKINNEIELALWESQYLFLIVWLIILFYSII